MNNFFFFFFGKRTLGKSEIEKVISRINGLREQVIEVKSPWSLGARNLLVTWGRGVGRSGKGKARACSWEGEPIVNIFMKIFHCHIQLKISLEKRTR